MKTIRVRPVLLPTNYINATLTLYHDGKGKYPKLSTDLNKLQYHTNQELILISLEDEKIEVGNKYYDEHNNLVLTATTQSDHNIYHYKKIVATQEQLSPELINQLITDYNNGGIKDFEIEMVEITEPIQDGHWNKYTQLLPKITNGFVTVVEKEYSYNLLCNMQYYMEYCQENGYVTPQEWLKKFKHYTDKKEPILYTEEEVKELFNSFRKDFPLHRGIQITDYDLNSWFNQNKKK